MTKVHMIGNAHLDPVWLWRWQEGCSEVLATFRSALDRMNEFDDYVFTCAGAAYYAWVEEIDPEMFEEIKKRVQEGRWVIVGGWWIQPDCNTPSGESYARHALYSQRYYREKFGKIAEIGYNVDSFGHNAMIPQLLKLGGMRGYVFMRPNDSNEMTYPFPTTAFNWVSPDGTVMPTYRIVESYNSANWEHALRKAADMTARCEQYALPEMMFYGVGNHGGGPTVRTVRELTDLINRSDEGEYAFSSPNTFFDELKDKSLPVFQGELQHHASGCYTTVMEIKKLNRLAEMQLLAAEKYCAMAEWLGFHVDAEPLKDAWKTVLFNHFHDIMGGCSIMDACRDAVMDLNHALHAAQQVTNYALQKLAWNIDTSKGLPPVLDKRHFKLWENGRLGTPVTLFNPHSWPLRVPVRAGENAASVEDETGTPVPTQIARSQVTNGKHDKWESLFIAELPPMGWRTYWLQREPEKTAEPSARSLSFSDTHLENDFVRAEFDPATGALIRLTDKAHNRELISRPALDLIVDETECDTWSHNQFIFRNVVDTFGKAEVRLAESGDVYASLYIQTHAGNSTITRTVTLYRDLPGLYFNYLVNWNEKHRMLKLSFPTPFDGRGEVASIPYGAITRSADGKEQPMQNWVSIGGLGVVTDTRTAYDAYAGEIRVTALRSPIYADHYGARDEFCQYMAQGEERFNLVLTPDCAPEAMTKLAGEMVCPPERILGTYHKGRLGEVASAAAVAGDPVVVSAVKRAEDGNGWIVRAHEIRGCAAKSCISLPVIGKNIDLTLTPWQIVTLRVTEDGVCETDFTEA